jgi:ATP-dependent DNA helicase RecQ
LSQQKALSVLKQFWGYDQFRSPQDEIIESVLHGNDTLALLPTGGGKSLCYQVPALVMEKLVIVVSPLIALMNDQVKNLKDRGIKAVAITGELSTKDIDRELDNCVNGYYQLLYLSPERLRNEYFEARAPEMNIGLIAVDEAHCISEWGFDFRPAFREISQLRELLPGVPVLALTASATQAVIEDIMTQLQFRKENVIRKSFRRENLIYALLKTDNKWGKLIEILRKRTGTAIVYARTRKETLTISRFLNERNIKATSYHGGMDSQERATNQALWMNNGVQVMVATTAFGMGIDKPDVRTVIHVSLPEGPEAYFQEAGRGGRDGITAFSIILIGPDDLAELNSRVEWQQVSLEDIHQSYEMLCSFLQLPIGAGEDTRHEISLSDLSVRYKIPTGKLFSSIKMLERSGVVLLSEKFGESSKVKMRINYTELYEFQLMNASKEHFIKTLLRMYGGIFDQEINVNEKAIAKQLNILEQEVISELQSLHKNEIIYYSRKSANPSLFMLLPRVSPHQLPIDRHAVSLLERNRNLRRDMMVKYATQELQCRSEFLLNYFGEEESEPCGKCDICRNYHQIDLNKDEFDRIREHILHHLRTNGSTIGMLQKGSHWPETKILQVLRWMMDAHEIEQKDEHYHLKS